MKFTGIVAAFVLVTIALTGFIATYPVHAVDCTAYQIDRGHTGYTTFTTPPRFPLVKKWAVSLPGPASYPIIAYWRVFVLSGSINGGAGMKLHAFDAHSGSALWTRDISGSYYWGALTYGDGRLFVLNYDGILKAINPISGRQIWITQLPGQFDFSSAPTFSNGIVYTGGAGAVYAVNASTGKLLWTQSVEGGDDSSPAVSDSTVYVSYACNQAYAFNAKTGKSLWHYSGECEGGGGKTTVLSPQYGLFTRDYEGNLILKSTNGKLIGDYSASFAPAVAGNRMFTMTHGELTSVDQDSGLSLWSFTGDGTLSTAPIVVNKNIFVGGTSGNLYALDMSGKVVWSTNVGAPIPSPDEQNVSEPLTGLGAGDALIIVPAGSQLVAYGN